MTDRRRPPAAASRATCCRATARRWRSRTTAATATANDGRRRDQDAAGVEANAWNFGTFTPDGNAVPRRVYDGVLVVRDYATRRCSRRAERRLGHAPRPVARRHAARLRARRPCRASTGRFGSGQIFTRTYDQRPHTFGPESMLVADANNNYYPSFSPDGQWILFNKSTTTRQPARTTTPSASLWVIKADGSAPPIQLAKLEHRRRPHQLVGPLGAVRADRRQRRRADVLDHGVDEARLRRAARRLPTTGRRSG